MELKVWVDGIQRVVCGANLATTCQDVVVALAHAMGRTGRFTLIEKWRDVERPLTPGECPLKSLHKWGEYAAEVRFYLMQADQQHPQPPEEKPPPKSPKQRSAHAQHQHQQQLAEPEDDYFSHNFTPPLPQQQQPPLSTSTSSGNKYLTHQPYSQPSVSQQQRQIPHQALSTSLSSSSSPHPVPDAVKRSSTFSGAVNSNYAPPVPPSTSLHAKLDSLKQQQQPQYHHHHQQQQQPPQPPPYQHRSLPRQSHNHSGQTKHIQQQQSVNNNNKNNNIDKASSQQYQNVLPAVQKPSQKTANDLNKNSSPRYQPNSPAPPPHHHTHPHHQAKSQPHRQNNGNLSAHSSASSNNSSSSPRNLSSNPNSLSPGRGRSGGGPPTNDISSSPSQDSRYLHPANTPRPSETYSNFPPDPAAASPREHHQEGTHNKYNSPDPKQQQPSSQSQQQQQQQSTKPTKPSIPASARPAPKPAPRSNQPRQHSPSSSTPYENLPPRRSSQNQSAEPSPLLSSNIPDTKQMVVRPPPRRRREPPTDSKIKQRPENENAQIVVQQHEDLPSHQWNGRNNLTNNTHAPQENDYSRGEEDSSRYQNQKKVNDNNNRYIASSSRSNGKDLSKSTNNNDHNFNSDLSDDCFQVQGPTTIDPSAKTHQSNFTHNNDTTATTNKYMPRSPNQSREQPLPGSSSKIQSFFPTPTPQLSQKLPSFSSSPTRSSRLVSETGGQRTTKSQTLPSTTSAVTPERTRRSEGGKVNFVESALLRQQRSNPDINIDNKNNQFEFVAEEGRKKPRDSSSSRDRKPSGERYYSNSGNRSSRENLDPLEPLPYSSDSQPFSGYTVTDKKYYEETNTLEDDFTDSNFSSATTPFTNKNQPSSSSPLEYPYEYQQQQNDSHHQSHLHPQSQQQQQQQHHQHSQSPHSQLQSPRTSAFKVVSPRGSNSNYPNSSPSNHSSPISPVSYDPPPLPQPPIAYNLDNQNFDLPVNVDHPQHHQYHPHSPHSPPQSSSYPEFPITSSSSPIPSFPASIQRPHSRQASLEIEEYDLDQNFPDISHKDKGHHLHHYPPSYQSSTLPRVASGRRSTSVDKQGQGHTEYVMDRPGGVPVSMEPEYMRILRQVKMQQEQLKMLESQADEMDTEISALETDQSNLDLKLDVVSTELESLEKTEEAMLEELVELERVEWVNVLDGEVKCQQDLTGQMSKLRVELTGREKKIGELNEEEKAREDALKKERQHLEEAEKMKEVQMLQQLTDAKKDLSVLDAVLRQREDGMKALEEGISETVDKIKSQEQEAERLEKLLHNENLKEFQSNPVPKEPAPVSETAKITTDIDNNIIITKAPVVEQQPSLPVPSSSSLSSSSSSRPTTPRSRPPSETGEAILKILEGRQSPRASPSPSTNDDSSGNVGDGSTQHPSTVLNAVKTSTTLVKNPNGVWV